MGFACHSIDIRYHLAALLDGVADDFGVFGRQQPRLLVDGGVLGGMAAQDGTQGAKLHPAGVQFGFDGTTPVAADIVAPEAIQHIACR